MYEMKWNEMKAWHARTSIRHGASAHTCTYTCHMNSETKIGKCWLGLSGVLDDDDVPYGQVRELGRKRKRT